MNRISDPGFELGLVWLYEGAAARVTTPAPRSGAYSAKLTGSRGELGGNLSSALRQIEIQAPGTPLTFYVNPDGIASVLSIHLQLFVTWDNGSGPVEIGIFNGDDWPDGWSALQVTPPAGAGTLAFEVGVPAVNGSGFWLLDDLSLESGDDVKLRDIRDAIVVAIRGVQIGNGYAVNIGEVVTQPMLLGNSVQSWPHVEVLPEAEEVETHTFGGRVRCTVSFPIVIACEGTGDAVAADLVRTCYGEIQKALHRGPGDSGASTWLGLAYVQDVLITNYRPISLPPEAERGISSAEALCRVSYHRGRLTP